MSPATSQTDCESCRFLRDELERCRARNQELEAWKARHDEWRSSWQFKRGLLIGFLLISLIANLASLALR